MSFFNYKNKKVYYEEIGTGKPVLLLHGNTASSNMFLDIIESYTSNYKVILIDFLGHGKSDRLEEFPIDLWFDEAQQVISFLKEKKYNNVNLIGSSGGALVAINVALETPELVDKVIADSFEGEKSLKKFTKNIIKDRELSKNDENAKMFYKYMHGDNWEKIVDNDTKSIVEHDKTIGNFFHKPLETLQSHILLTGSKEDEILCSISPNYFQDIYIDMLRKIEHGEIYLFESGGHPAMISNKNEFVQLSKRFFEE